MAEAVDLGVICKEVELEPYEQCDAQGECRRKKAVDRGWSPRGHQTETEGQMKEDIPQEDSEEWV